MFGAVIFVARMVYNIWPVKYLLRGKPKSILRHNRMEGKDPYH